MDDETRAEKLEHAIQQAVGEIMSEAGSVDDERAQGYMRARELIRLALQRNGVPLYL